VIQRQSGDILTPKPQDSVSLLGLREGAVAHGELDQASARVDLLFVAAGLVLGCGGWWRILAVPTMSRPSMGAGTSGMNAPSPPI
jgi:hypothetical protein